MKKRATQMKKRATQDNLPWRLEKKLILRKLELIAGDTLAYLELLRTSADQQLKRSLVEYIPILPGYLDTAVVPPVMSQVAREEVRYIVSIANVEDVFRSEKFIWLFTRWYRRDRYLQVAVHGLGRESSGIAVCLKWGRTEKGYGFARPEANVYVKHPDNIEGKNLHLKQFRGVIGPSELFLFHEMFRVEWVEVYFSGLSRGGKITLVVSFNKW